MPPKSRWSTFRELASDLLRSAPSSRTVVILWSIGALTYLMMNLLQALHGHDWLRKVRRPFPEDVPVDAVGLLQAYGVRRLPRIWIVDGIGQPFVWGLLRGNIYVPPGFLSLLNPEHRREILAHELSHVLRFDAAVNALQIIAQGLFWFHPLVWWANKRIRREREKCCDEMVIAGLKTNPRDYSTTIIEALARAAESAQPVPSLAVAGRWRHIEERITTMLQPGKRFYRRPGLAAVVLVLLIALLVVPTTVVLTVHPKQLVSGAIHISPTVPGPQESKPKPFDREGYAAFMATQAVLLTSNGPLLQLVADDLAGRGLTSFSSARSGPVGRLRQVVADGVIRAAAVPGTELLELTMVSEKGKDEEAKTIVDSFLRNYVAHWSSNSITEEVRDLNRLEAQQAELLKSIADRRAQIRALAGEDGKSGLERGTEEESRQRNWWFEELMRVEQRRVSLEATIESSGADVTAADSQDLLSRRQNYVDSDPVIQALSRRIADLRVDLATARENDPNDTAALQGQQNVLDALDQQLVKLRQARRQQFEEEQSNTLKQQAQERLAKAKLELQQTHAYKNRLQQILNLQQSQATQAGRKNQDMQDLQSQLQMDQELYDQISRRIRTLQMEGQYAPRVKIAYRAEVRESVDSRWQWALIALGATLVLTIVVSVVRRALRPRLPINVRP